MNTLSYLKKMSKVKKADQEYNPEQEYYAQHLQLAAIVSHRVHSIPPVHPPHG